MQAKMKVVEAVLVALKSIDDGLVVSSDELFARLERPKDPSMGDIAFPCFSLSKALKKGPPQISAMLLDGVKQYVAESKDLQEVNAAGPYLNFFLSTESLAEIVPQITSGSLLNGLAAKDEHVMIEYSQPNTHKAFHVGHMRNVALGDSLVRMYEYAGHKVTAANYIGDEGAHIAKCLWVYQNKKNLEVPDENRGEFLGGLYREADTLLDFYNLTEYPFPGLIVAEVLDVSGHEKNEKWQVVKVNTGSATETVICGGKGFGVGDKVAYVPLGEKFAGREIVEKDMMGVISRGMMCSEKELKVSNKKEQILKFDAGAEVGIALTELGRKEGVLAADVLVADEMARRNREVSETLKQLEDKSSPIQALWSETRDWSLGDFKDIYEWLNCRFDHYFFESEVGDEGKQVVLKAHEEGKLVSSEGTIGADLSKHKLGYLMLLKSDGTGLYATKDIALAEKKFEKFDVDRSVYVVDDSQSLHFSQVFKTLELLGYEQAKKCFHLAYGLVTVPEGKMSSRKGTVIYFSALKETLIDHLLTEQLAKHRDEWSQDELLDAARKIAIATIKYGMLNQDNLKSIVFDMKEWTSLTGNTGPYLLYAYARTRSIGRKVGQVGGEFNPSLLDHKDERILMNELNAFNDVVSKSVDLNRPQGLCIYLYGLARAFSRMFESCSVAHAENEDLKASRLRLVEATGSVLKKGLELLGISTLEKM
jgi:arginyl-tRNA synthetase